MQEVQAIPRETALQLCQEIRQENRGKWYTVRGLQCWWCSTFSGSPEKRCFASKADNRGCRQVNAQYDALPQTDFVLVSDTVAEPVEESPAEIEAESGFGSGPVIYLPPAGFSATQRKRSCVACGRPFRIAASQPDNEYCPTCDYRRLRGQLIAQTPDDAPEDQEEE